MKSCHYSGHCIELHKRCDTKMDCADKSDEVNCQYVSLSDTYLKELIPRSREVPEDDLNDLDDIVIADAASADANATKKDIPPLKVYVNISIMTFPSIDTVGLQFTADVFLNLRWFDQRVVFYNLVIKPFYFANKSCEMCILEHGLHSEFAQAKRQGQPLVANFGICQCVRTVSNDRGRNCQRKGDSRGYPNLNLSAICFGRYKLVFAYILKIIVKLQEPYLLGATTQFYSRGNIIMTLIAILTCAIIHSILR